MDSQSFISDQMQITDRRRAERVRTLLKAKIYCSTRTTSFDCIVKNISPSGAKVEIDKNAAVPSEFELEIPARGKLYNAKLSWRDATSIGMEFVEDSMTKESTARSAKRLIAENSRLRQAILTLGKKLEDLGQDVPDFF